MKRKRRPLRRFAVCLVLLLSFGLVFGLGLLAGRGELDGLLEKAGLGKMAAAQEEVVSVQDYGAQETVERNLEPKSQAETGVPESIPAETTPADASGTGKRSLEDGYCYQQLDDEKKLLYRQIYQALCSFEKDVELKTLKEDLLEPVFRCVLNDNPEIFYVDGYTYTLHTLGEELRQITFSGSYTLTQSESLERQKGIDAYADACLAGIQSDMSDYDKIKYIYDYIVENTEYDLNAAENQTICSVFLYGSSVCQGYAKSMQYLLQKLGIPACLVTGTVDSGEAHAWDLVQADGEWYYVDPTWGDAYYLMGEDDPAYRSQARPSVNYDYLCVTTKQLERTHRIDSVVPLPECTSMADNYYIKENAYFEEVDEEQIGRLFSAGYEKGQSFVTLKCADGDVYEAMEKLLIGDQKIFEYLAKGQDNVTYSNSKQQFTLSFWLE